ncbi:MAG: hypothetical protein WAO76_08275, partial [Georgfuchsia sp.]
MADSSAIDADEQIGILKDLADAMQDSGFKPGTEHIKLNAEPEEFPYLDELLAHLVLKCDLLTAFPRATPHFYSPLQGDELQDPPSWWPYLTVECWKRLLDDTVGPPKGSSKIECTNSLIPATKGMVAVVKSEVKLKVSMAEAIDVSVVREGSGAANKHEWQLSFPGAGEIVDQSVPPHKAPVRYSAEAIGYKKGSLRVISLNSWQPGVIIYSRTASKVTPPKSSRDKKAKVAYETSLVLNGQGRHYLDVFVGPGVEIGGFALGSDESGMLAEGKTSSIAKISDEAYGFEVDATADCYYDVEIMRGGGNADTIRVYLNCDETTPDQCSSEFERLIGMNRLRGAGRATTDVQVNRHLRCTDLEGWMLEKSQIEKSFMPLVIASDYMAAEWRSRDWSSSKDTILSGGGFLHDPRPQVSAFSPPKLFLESRRDLAERIRGKDENGLVESSRLGEWLASDQAFAETIETYVRSYLEWLEAEPDVAAWVDLSVVTEFESDGVTLVQEPYAILISPLHPIRLAWHCLAQRTLFLAARKMPCPAASILDPDSVIDVLTLPLYKAAGNIKGQVFFSVECSSDYWGVLWNGGRLDRLSKLADHAPFDREFGILVGGVSSGFSASQVHRALDDVSGMLVAKPILNVLVTSAAGQNNACNDGLVTWCRKAFGVSDEPMRHLAALGPRLVQILDGREGLARPDDAEISNL